MKKTRNTIILTAVLILAAAGGLLVQHFVLKKEGSCAIVQSYGEEIARLPLDKEDEILVQAQNGYNRICTSDGFVFVAEADCPDKICVHEGRIQSTGEVIACLPHELIITIEEPEAEGVDSAAW